MPDVPLTKSPSMMFISRSCMDEEDFSFQPTNGGKQTTKLITHAPAINSLAFFEVIRFGYVIGCVTAIYRSKEITTKCNMEAVHIQTSTANHILHQTFPNIHIENISYTALKGNTTRPSIRSAQAEKEDITVNLFLILKYDILKIISIFIFKF